MPLLLLVAGLTTQGSTAPAAGAELLTGDHPRRVPKLNVSIQLQRRQVPLPDSDASAVLACAGAVDRISEATCTSALANGQCGGPISLACSRTCSNCTEAFPAQGVPNPDDDASMPAASCHDLQPGWADANGDTCGTYESRTWLVVY